MRYGEVFQDGPLPALIMDLDFRILQPNQRACELLALSSAELASLALTDLAPEETRLQLLRQRDLLLAGRQRDFTMEARFTSGGNVIQARVSAAAARSGGDGAPAHLVAILQGQRAAETGVPDTEGPYRQLLDDSPVGALIHCAGMVVYVNRMAVSLFEAGNGEELIGRTTLSLIHPDYHGLIRERAQGAYERKVRQPNQEVRAITMTGRTVWIEGAASPIEWNGQPAALVSFHDVTSRKETERMLRLTKHSVERSSTPVLWIAEDGHFAYANDAACRHFGYPLDELLQQSVSTVDPDRPALGWAEFWNMEKAARSLTFETRHRRRDGSIVPVQVTTNYFEFEGEEYLHAFITDITERKAAEEVQRRSREELERLVTERTRELAREKQLLETVVQHVPTPVFVKDTQLRYLLSNPAHVAHLGRQSAAEVVGRRMEDFAAAETAAEAEARDRLVIESGRPFLNWEESFVDRGGRQQHILVTVAPLRDPDGGVTGIVGVSWDIGERRRMEQELRRSQERLQLVLDGTNDGWWDYDVATRAAFYSKRWFTMLGYQPDEFPHVHDSWARLCHPDDLAYAEGELRKRIAAPGPMDMEYRLRRKDGTWAWVRTRGNVVEVAPDGTAARLAGANTDITASKTAELALREYARKLEWSNRELQQFAYVASHDLQEPLRKIRAFGDRLRTDCAGLLPDRDADYLNRMIKSSARMQAMVDGLLNLARVTTQGQPFKRVAVLEVVRGVLSDLELQIEECGARIELGDLPVVYADRIQVHQLLQNLVSNSLKFRREGAVPMVRIGPAAAEQPLTGPKLAGFSVADNGIGFAPEYSDRIWQPFQRLNARTDYEGTGIGLAICHRIVERHGGRVLAASEPGKGSVFTVWLPAKPA